MIIDTDDCDSIIKNALRVNLPPERYKELFKRRPKDDSKHNALKLFAIELLKKKGYDKIISEWTIDINGKRLRIDVVGLIDGEHIVAVECGNVDFTKIALLESKFKEVIVIPYNYCETYFTISNSYIECEKINGGSEIFVKAKKFGGSIYIKINPADKETLKIDDGEIYEIEWLGLRDKNINKICKS